MKDVLGIIKFEDATVDVAGLGKHRPIPSLTFLGRYRLIDFMMSNLSNSGISYIQVYVKNKPRSVYEHLGSGRSFNINSKHGKLRVFHGEEVLQSEAYNTDIRSFISNRQFIEEARKEYVIIASSYMVYTIDFNNVLAEHKKSNADITIVYSPVKNANESFFGCDTLNVAKNRRIIGVGKNLGKYKTRNVSLETYVMKKSLFLKLCDDGFKTSSLYWLNNTIKDNLDKYQVLGYPHRRLVYPINSLAEYHKANLELTNYHISKNLFDPNWPILTRTSDSPPVRYGADALVTDSVIANGCIVNGTVVNSVLGRGVIIDKGAVILNSNILPGSKIGKGIHLDHVIVDKNAVVEKVNELKGRSDAPIYVKRRDRI
jgi:glucose-1-phosphate adenylyltransferase